MKPISLHLIKFSYNGWQFDKLTMAALRNIMTKRKLIIYMKTEKKPSVPDWRKFVHVWRKPNAHLTVNAM